MIIRASTPSDVPRLHAVWRAAVLATHDFLSTVDFAEIAALVRDEYLPHAALVVAEEDGTALGFMGLSGAHVDALFVDPGAHGRGIGRALIERARAERGPLTVDVNEQNAGELGFYEQMGFVVVGRSATDDQGRPYPLLRMAMR